MKSGPQDFTIQGRIPFLRSSALWFIGDGERDDCDVFLPHTGQWAERGRGWIWEKDSFETLQKAHDYCVSIMDQPWTQQDLPEDMEEA